jgi:DNA-binding transcriptional regulator YhcF (GntR family)
VQQPLTVTDVYRRLLDRISADAYAPGARLPSCRQLAADLGSNPSTVDRAVKRLAEAGLVRTVPRRGTFVVHAGPVSIRTYDDAVDEFERVLAKAWRSGIALQSIRSLVNEAVERLEVVPKVAFVECNEPDLERLRELVQQASGVEVVPVLLDDARGRLLDDEFDVVTAPVFHLDDLTGVVSDFDRVVEIDFAASRPVLRRLVALRNVPRLAVAASSDRAVAWMSAVVGQYYAGVIEPFQIGVDSPARLDGIDVVVKGNAAELPDGYEARVPEVVAMEWQLDPRFSSSLGERVADVLALRRSVGRRRAMIDRPGHTVDAVERGVEPRHGGEERRMRLPHRVEGVAQPEKRAQVEADVGA